jgi:hypothetical protein
MEVLMRLVYFAVLVYFIGFPALAGAYPILDAVVGLPNPELVTVYPDDADPDLFYFVPTSVEIVRDQNGQLRLGVQHWGITAPDANGIGAALTFSVRPAFDQKKLQDVADAVKKTHPNAKWAAMPVVCSRMEVIINGHFLGPNQTIQAGPTAPYVAMPPAPSPAAPSHAVALAPTPAATAADPDATSPTQTDQTGEIKYESPVTPSFCPNTSLPNTPIVSRGGTVDAIQAFSVSLTSIGARAFSQGTSSETDVLGARYTYVVRGVGNRLHARITVNTKRVYEHFKARATAHAWWGLVNSDWSADWQSLTNDGSIKVEFLTGGIADSSTKDEDYMMTIFKLLVSAKIAGTGMFKPELQAGGISGAPEAASFGWGFSGGGGWEKLTEQNNLVLEIARQSLEERELSAALTFNTVCAAYPNNFVDLTTLDKQCINKKSMANLVKRVNKCKDGKYTVWKQRLDAGQITQATFQKRTDEIEDKPCY